MTRSRLASIALAGTVLLVALSAPVGIVGAQPVPGDSGAAANAADQGLAGAPAPQASPISMNLVSTSPIAPPVKATDTTVTVLVAITNNSDNALQQVQLRGLRDSPIIRQSALDEMLANPKPPADNGLTQTIPALKYPDAIAAHSTVQLSYRFPASSLVQSGGVCLCQNGIYPIDLSAYAATSSTATPTQVGWVQTYLVSVAATPAPERVSWLWPLIDHPHRLSDDTPFIDDELASDVAPGGRLDRALQVLEQLGPTSQVTAVIDPELIDELQQMSLGYRVQQGATSVAGTGQAAAADWLRRLRAAAATMPIALTPYGDPAVNAAAAAHQTWQATLPAAIASRVEQALGRTVTAADSTLAWPPGETLTADALGQLAADGTTTVVVNDSTLPGGKTAIPPLVATASVAVPGSVSTPVHALVTSAVLEQRVDGLLATGGSQLAGLPALLAGLSLRALQTGASPSYVVLTPNRYVDSSPATAVAVITATSQSSWSNPITAITAANTIAPADHGTLVAPDAAHFGGSPELIARAGATSAFATEFASAVDPADAQVLLAGFPMSAQLCLSAGWSGAAAPAARFDATLAAQTNDLSGRVQILRPSNGSYSLASASSPVLITVVNTLPVPVTVRISMTSVGGVPGFRADDAGPQVIAANSRRTVKIQAHVARSGHFRVQAQLLMPAGAAFGAPMPLSVYSSALGTIGVVITVVAAAVLILALIVRFTRRWRHHRDLIRRMMAEEQLVPAGARG